VTRWKSSPQRIEKRKAEEHQNIQRSYQKASRERIGVRNCSVKKLVGGLNYRKGKKEALGAT